MTKAEKRKRLAEVDDGLKAVYPDAACSLEYEGPIYEFV